MPRQFFNDTAITVAGVKIHAGIDFCRIVPQNLLYTAGLLKEGLPVRGGEQAQAEKTVGDNAFIRQRRGRRQAGLARSGSLAQRLPVIAATAAASRSKIPMRSMVGSAQSSPIVRGVTC